MCGFVFSFRKSSTAEAPRRHVGQVGERSKTIRTSPEAALKAVGNGSKLLGVSHTNGGCPAGTLAPPWKCQPRTKTPTSASSARMPRGFFIGDRYRICQRACWQSLEEREGEEIR